MLYSFPNGSLPLSDLIADKQGNFYGTTYGGGAQQSGTIFEITPDWSGKTGSESTLYSFDGGSAGASPWSLVRDSRGNFFGVTKNGGYAKGCDVQLGCGTIFELTSKGTQRVLHNFGNPDDGAVPFEGLFLGPEDVLYGTTTAGGGYNCDDRYNGHGCGTVFSLNK